MDGGGIHFEPFVNGIRFGSQDGNWRYVLNRVVARIQMRFVEMEIKYMKLKNISLLINQLVFLCLCERLLIPHQPVTSFYTLMFFNVIAYCIAYVKELIERENWSMYITIAETSNVRHLAMTTTKVVLEWTKAITFTITIVFMLLVFGLEKGLRNYNPTVTYLVITWSYYSLTEKVFNDMLYTVLDYIKFDCFENMEHLYFPVILKSVQIVCSMLAVVVCFILGHLKVALVAMFTNVRVKYKELDDCWYPLRRALLRLSGYRPATQLELLQHDDVCAVCLNRMSSARITPCQHFFHAECLRRCLNESTLKCPICQFNLPTTPPRRQW